MSESIAERSATRMDQHWAAVLVPATLAFVGAAALSAWGVYGEAHPETGEYMIVLGIIAATTALVFAWIVPRGLQRESAGKTALVLSLLGLVTVAVFWSGLPVIFGMGGIVLGWAGRDGVRGSGLSKAAVVLGLLAIATDVVVYISDMAF